MFTNILVAVDGSDHSSKAVEVAGDLAAKYDARLHIITVMKDVALPNELHRFAEAEHIKGSDAQVSTYIADRIVESAATTAKQAGAGKIESGVLMGDIVEKILERAEAVKADLIVLGSRGLSDFRGLMLGSISHKIANTAPCTCITVR